MKAIRKFLPVIIAVLAACTTSCEEKAPVYESFDWGEIGPFVELVYADGKYSPKSAPMSQEAFDAGFYGAWAFYDVRTLSSTGKIYIAEMPADEPVLCFAIKEGNTIRQYIKDPVKETYEYKDGTYSYDPTTGIIYFKDVLDKHPEFRVIYIKDGKLTGTFKGENNTSDSSVLTHLAYERLASIHERDLDVMFGAIEEGVE